MGSARLTNLAHNLSDEDTVILLNSASKLVAKIERASQESIADKAVSKSLETVLKGAVELEESPGKRIHSFSEFVSMNLLQYTYLVEMFYDLYSWQQ